MHFAWLIFFALLPFTARATSLPPAPSETNPVGIPWVKFSQGQDNILIAGGPAPYTIQFQSTPAGDTIISRSLLSPADFQAFWNWLETNQFLSVTEAGLRLQRSTPDEPHFFLLIDAGDGQNFRNWSWYGAPSKPLLPMIQAILAYK